MLFFDKEHFLFSNIYQFLRFKTEIVRCSGNKIGFDKEYFFPVFHSNLSISFSWRLIEIKMTDNKIIVLNVYQNCFKQSSTYFYHCC